MSRLEPKHEALQLLSHIDSFLVFDASRFTEVMDILGIDRFDKKLTSLHGDFHDIWQKDSGLFQIKFNNIKIIFCKEGLQETVSKFRGAIEKARNDGREEVLTLLKSKSSQPLLSDEGVL